MGVPSAVLCFLVWCALLAGPGCFPSPPPPQVDGGAFALDAGLGASDGGEVDGGVADGGVADGGLLS